MAGYHAGLAMLIAEVVKYADQAFAAPNHEPAPARPAPRFCDGLLIRVAMDPGCTGKLMFVVEEKEAAKLHSHSPCFEAEVDTISVTDL
jgi:hypothetical protein